MLYWKLRDLIGCAISASPDADFLEKIILTTPNARHVFRKKNNELVLFGIKA